MSTVIDASQIAALSDMFNAILHAAVIAQDQQTIQELADAMNEVSQRAIIRIDNIQRGADET